MKTVIHWFRRDLRLTDNPALSAAVKSAESVVPVYIQSTWSGSHRWTGSHRQEFLCGALASLDRNLKTIGGRLLVRRGKPLDELGNLVRETNAEAIFFNRDPDPFGRTVEDQLRRLAGELRIEIREFKDVCLHERDEVLTGTGNPFRVFTPYANAWLKLEKPAPAGKLKTLNMMSTPRGRDLPSLADWELEPSGPF